MFLGDTSEYHVAVGLKGPEGVTTAEVSFGDIKKECDIKGASDLYYEVNADENGFVIIKNTGDNLLSVTKLKKSGTILAGQEKILGQSFSLDEMPARSIPPCPVLERLFLLCSLRARTSLLQRFSLDASFFRRYYRRYSFTNSYYK